MPGQDQYMLQRDFQASCRLNLQTYLWRDSLGYIIHPAIPPLPANGRVADVGTGTGLWLAQLHSEQQKGSIRMDGFDIDITQCPTAGWLPDNIHFQQWNATERPPSELHGQFDLVHLRLVMIGISNEDVSALVEHLSLLLKPGGWLQWEEMNNFDNKVLTVDEATPKTAITELLQWMTIGPKERRKGNEWRLTIPGVLQQHGFTNVTVENHMDPPHLRRWLTEVSFQTLTEFASKQFAPDSKEATWLTQILADAHGECKNGAAIHMGKLICLAQKVGGH
ncbi:S-adenosyl-L-methionine-dependent methyltransferase [Aspergillus bertholletiae]|uniref:S-adenosyl-L-methionine-dependent methyltransferase n=1 Tax=Aspergillus bertholletiae TaxID=1226010 RepID=A0A5N7B8E3_9EURO|nr:S-adenosyl-L-methionine-dependent methyltransferase [Aspergillus bertholletiae]